MTSRRMMWTGVAIAVTAAIGVSSLASAQQVQNSPTATAAGDQNPPARRGGGGFGGGPPPYTPAKDAKDLKSVLFNWAWYTGMLRSTEERDLLMTLVYEGKGTMQVDGQPCNVTKYRSDISYRASGERVRITGTRPGGGSCNTIQVVSGAYAWNEDIMGAELVPGKGKATPQPATVEERMIRLWANPQGAWKAAMAGTGYITPPDVAQRPQMVPADVATAGKTSVKWNGNTPVVTFPIPGIPSATATATLDAKFMPTSVVVKNGGDTYEFTYGNYKDWNNPLNPAEVFYTGKITEKKNGTVLSDITTTVTETGQMYVIVPVPASVKAAIKPKYTPVNWTLTGPLPGAQGPGGQPANAPTAAKNVATPRRADGKPDLAGWWGRAPNPVGGNGNRRCGPTQVKGGGINPTTGCTGGQDNFWVEYEWISPSRFGILGLPQYKPEFWDHIQEMDQWTNRDDPIMTCKPIGIPRHGTPNRILQTDHDVIFFYGANADYGGGNNEYRDIPTDGRARSKQDENLSTFYGQSIGHWEGDTLVIDSTNFDDATWLGRGGFFHTGSMHTVEKLTRVGNELRYDMTIEDPEAFIEPWVMPTRVLPFAEGAGQNRVQPERANCEVYEEGNETSQVRH
ncbi:MAG TPA: hypothetical protein VFX89_19940 [Gammaproteobacteria bacterium]|nr:hypothetical protein [Gammaproteobacteria bacterium]